MVEKVKPLKFVFDPLYWTEGTIYQNTPSGNDVYESMTDGGNGNYSGHILSSDWEAESNNKLNDCFEINLINRQEIDLTGLTIQEIALAPLGNASQTMEPFAFGYNKGNRGEPLPDMRGFVREYVFYTTQPITNQTLYHTIFNTASPIPPYAGSGNLSPEQLVAGYSRTWVKDTVAAPLDGFCVKIQESKLGFGDIINAPKLYCTKVIKASLRIQGLATTNCSGGNVTAPRFLDIPSSTEVITVAEIEPDTVEYFASMARSLQPPTKPE